MFCVSINRAVELRARAGSGEKIKRKRQREEKEAEDLLESAHVRLHDAGVVDKSPPFVPITASQDGGIPPGAGHDSVSCSSPIRGKRKSAA